MLVFCDTQILASVTSAKTLRYYKSPNFTPIILWYRLKSNQILQFIRTILQTESVLTGIHSSSHHKPASRLQQSMIVAMPVDLYRINDWLVRGMVSLSINSTSWDKGSCWHARAYKPALMFWRLALKLGIWRCGDEPVKGVWRLTDQILTIKVSSFVE